MLLLPNFRLPTLIIPAAPTPNGCMKSATKPGLDAPRDAQRLGVGTGEPDPVETEIGYSWTGVGHGRDQPGVIAMSHHLGRWRFQETGVNPGMSNLAQLAEDGQGGHTRTSSTGPGHWDSFDPDTSRVWWQDDVGVHQNLTHAVHPDPISGRTAGCRRR